MLVKNTKPCILEDKRFKLQGEQHGGKTYPLQHSFGQGGDRGTVWSDVL